MFQVNPILATDFYKVGHFAQYPQGTEMIYSNFTPRSNRLAPSYNGKKLDKIVVAGVQGFIKSFLIDAFNDHFFSKNKQDVLAEYSRRCDSSLGPGAVTVDHIAALHDLGYLPIHIKVLPEGSVVDMKIPVLTIRNTVKGFGWLTNYLESVISNSLWKSMTVASIAFEYRKLLTQYAVKTGSPLDFVLWQGHDFSMRGMAGLEDSASSSATHLFSFLGTDTIPAIEYLEHYYNAKNDFVGGSVPATEHSVMCAGGMVDEEETYRRLIEDIYPSGIVSIVSDTWDYWNVLTNTTVKLKDKILARQLNALGLAKVVFRPDSGDPVDIVCGIDYYEACEDDSMRDLYDNVPKSNVIKDYNTGKYLEVDFDTYYDYDGYYEVQGYEVIREVPEHEIKGSVEVLWDIFGGTITSTGHKLLNERVGLIYGDSITLERAYQILDKLEKKGYASGNVVFGIGSFTYQYMTRDTFGFAMKATYAKVNGVGRELYKDPKTDNGTKKSAKGLLTVQKIAGRYALADQVSEVMETLGELRTVFCDGHLLVDEDLATIRARLASYL